MENEKKKCKHVFFRNFPVAGNNWKEGKKNNEEKKWCAKSVGLLPNCIAKEEGFCVAIQSLYCRDLGLVG